MSTLKAFSEKERAYHAYQARQNFLRQQRSIQKELEAALQRAEAERKAKEAALAEIERLKAQLRDQ
jgi:LytS/YehU family sensor histidine kinase